MDRHRLATGTVETQKFSTGTGTGTGENSGPVGPYLQPYILIIENYQYKQFILKASKQSFVTKMLLINVFFLVLLNVFVIVSCMNLEILVPPGGKFEKQPSRREALPARKNG